MKKNIQQDIESLLLGSTLLGTGGGGSPEEAQKTYTKILNTEKDFPILASLDEFEEDAVFVTAFTVGSVSSDEDASEAIQRAYTELSRYLNKDIAGIVPVEIGAHCVAKAFYLASILDVPVLDADFVGGRSAPEVFLETITLFGLKRTPAAVANSAGDTALLLHTTTPQKEEEFFRQFARMSNSGVQVVGYPLTKKQLQQAVEHGTVSQALNIGMTIIENDMQRLLKQLNGKMLFQGQIKSIAYTDKSAFTICTVQLENNDESARLFIKNENIIFWVNDSVVLTCPDLIMLLNDEGKPIYNSDLEEEQQVTIIGAPARTLWRTQKGKDLFHPKLFGFDDVHQTLI